MSHRLSYRNQKIEPPYSPVGMDSGGGDLGSHRIWAQVGSLLEVVFFDPLLKYRVVGLFR